MLEKRVITTVKRNHVKVNLGLLSEFSNGDEVEVVIRLKENSHANTPIHAIVRYKKNGEYDCVWKSGLTRREAERLCEELNSDYHKNYGTYVVEECR